MKKVYLVAYSTGSYEDYQEQIVFVTESKDIAEKWVNKMKQLVQKVNIHYSILAENYEKYSTEYYQKVNTDRWNQCQDFNNAYYYEIEIR